MFLSIKCNKCKSDSETEDKYCPPQCSSVVVIGLIAQHTCKGKEVDCFHYSKTIEIVFPYNKLRFFLLAAYTISERLQYKKPSFSFHKSITACIVPLPGFSFISSHHSMKFGNIRRVVSLFLPLAIVLGPLPSFAESSVSISSNASASVKIQTSGSASARAKVTISADDHYIVILKDESAIDDVVKAHGAIVSDRFETAMHGFAGTISRDMLEPLASDARVALIEPDYVVTTYAQTLPPGINRSEADVNATAKINGKDERVNIDIAIIDTGIDLLHKDLNVYKNVNFVNTGSKGSDDNGHGTHVAGIAAAKDNTIGVVGMAPGARLWSVKVLDRNGSGRMSTIITGVDYVTQHADEIDVANMSLGCNCVSEALNQAISRAVAKGIVFTVAAGNDGKDAASYSPANHPDVITVSAIADYDGKAGGLGKATCRADRDDSLASFSNFGSVVDIAAPGVCVYSSWKNNMYQTISGTSMAAPHVAGAAALYIASHGKPANAADALAVHAALKLAAFEQSTVDGFMGDKDMQAEPLLNAASL